MSIIGKMNFKKVYDVSKNFGASIILFLSIITLWEFGVSDKAAKVLPKPSVIVRCIFGIWPWLWRNLKQTVFEAFLGFIVGTSLGVGIAAGFIYSKKIARTVYPFSILARCFPILAILPVLISWFGPGLTSKTILISLSTFFPTLVNMVQGFTSVDRNSLELMKTLDASRRQVFFKARLPSSLPYLFTSVKITITASVLAAIISEWMYATKGLGAFMVNAMFNAQVNRLWATMVISTLLSILAYIAAVVSEKLIVPWHSTVKEQKVGKKHVIEE